VTKYSSEIDEPIKDAQTKGTARIAAIDYEVADRGVLQTESLLPTWMPAKETPRWIDPPTCFDGLEKSEEIFQLHVGLKLMHRRSEGTLASPFINAMQAH
jgi:hypothetical protein